MKVLSPTHVAFENIVSKFDIKYITDHEHLLAIRQVLTYLLCNQQTCSEIDYVLSI